METTRASQKRGDTIDLTKVTPDVAAILSSGRSPPFLLASPESLAKSTSGNG
jgi:hypothetical protein